MKKLIAICFILFAWAAGMQNPAFATGGGSCTLSLSTSVANNTRCTVPCNGAVTLTVSGGTSPFTFKWSHGPTTQNLSALCAGSYTVTVTDKKGCVKTKSVSISDSQAQLSLSGTATNNRSCSPNLCTGSVSLAVSGGTAPYSYNWNAGTTTVTKAIANGNDDSEQYVSDGTNLINGTHVDLGYESSNEQIVGLRFTGVSIPAGATIVSAKIDFVAWASNSGTSNLVIKGEKAANSAAFTAAANTLSSRVKTSAAVSWSNVSAWTSNGTYASPDLKNIITEIRNNGWASGNALSFFITGTGTRAAHSYENYASKAAKLTVVYSTFNGANTSSLTNLCAGTYNVTVSDANGCSKTKSFTVANETSSISLSATAKDNTCCAPYSSRSQTSVNDPNCAGTINLTVTCSGPVTYLWSNGATTEDLSGLNPGAYTVTVSDAGGCSATKTVTVGGANLCNDYNACTLDQCVNWSCVYPTIVCNDNVDCTSDACVNGVCKYTPGAASLTATTATTPNTACNPPCLQQCFKSPTCPNIVNAASTWTINQAAGTVTIRTTLAKTFVDNTYGTNAIGWPSGHTFSNLTGSDNLQIALYDANNVKKLEFKMDYITASATYPSGYGTLGVSGGEGQISLGNASDFVNVKTSLSENFNTYGYVLTTNSPASNASYAPNATYPNWIYDVWYEVTVKLSAFGAAGFGSPSFVSVHASPSKTGNNTEVVVPSPCPEGTCPQACTGTINLTVNSGNGPYTYKWSNGKTTEDIASVCEGTYTVTITDANGCSATKSASVTQAPSTLSASATATPNSLCTLPCPETNQLCFESPTKPNTVNATSTWTINQNAQTITIRTTLAKTFVDNTYGTNAIGWPNGHTFSNLTGSDNLELGLYDKNGVKKLQFKMDYITASNTVPSGYKTLGVSGGEGQMSTGSAADVVAVKTSLSENFNTFGYVLTTNSPSTNASYAPNATYPNWIFEVWYEATIKLSAFGAAGFGYPSIASVHASPSKTGSNSEPVDSVHCLPPCVQVCNGAIDLTVSAGTAPYTYKWSNNATSQDLSGICDGTYTVTITDAAGCTTTVTKTITTTPCTDNNACTTDNCVNGQCVSTPIVCNDNDGCTTDLCVNGTCQYTPVTCNDQNACTTDLCVNGQCQYTPIICNDQDACTNDLCVNGTCQYTQVICNDLNACTNDICTAGQCQYTQIVCNDQTTCTFDFCIAGQCIYSPLFCGDNDACTIDECINGSCVHTPVACNDNNVCTIDLCINGQCQSTPIVCTDTDPCTNDICYGGICKHPAIVCNDNNACTTDLCVNGQCQYTPITCNDQNACTADLCVNGQCQYTAIICDDQNACTTDLCVNGQCEYTAIICDDQNACTTDLCVDGQCEYTAIICDDQDACTTELCVDGECEYTAIICDDQDACTTDLCVDGQCEYTAIICDDQDACTTDLCVNGQCEYTAIICDDQNACTTDLCVDGQCEYTAIICDDQDACTTDLCVEGECEYTSIICDDQYACTTDLCVDGQCEYTAIICDDQDACTTDFCVEGICDYSVIVCDDADECTIDLCVEGECQYTAVICDDQNACTIDLCISGSCEFTPIECDDQSACTADECVNGECVYTPNHVDLTTSSTNVTCDCIASTPGLCVLDFAGLEHGRILNTQYEAYGIHLSAVANDPGIDTLIIFNSFVTGTADADLEVDAGNLAIIPMSLTGGYADGIVDHPNDNIDGGVITLSFDQPRTVISFVIVDIDHLDGNPHAIAYDANNNVLKDIAIPILGDGSVQTVVMNQAGVSKLEINTHNSIGVTDFIFDCDTVACCNGTATVEASEGFGPYTYVWSNGAASASIDSLCPGEYCVTVTDANGCEYLDCVTVGTDTCGGNNPCEDIVCNDQDLCTNDICVEGQCQYNQRQCTDEDECTLDLCVAGECTFIEIPGCNDPCNNIICDDQDVCTTDACVNGSCEYTASGLEAIIAGTNPTACGACDGAASVQVTGGVAPFTYLWSTGDTTATISGAALPPFNGTEISINAGGTQLIHNGDTFLVDQHFSPGGLATATFANNNAGLVIDPLYRTERNAVPPGTGNGTMTYDIPVINGTYDIELHFAEIFYGVPGGNTSNPPHTNKRLFHVAIEGTQVLTNYDIVAEAGGPGIPVIETFTVTVTDGHATILFTNVPNKNRAKVSAISVKPHQEVGGGQGLCAGSYEVTVTDANGCTAVSSVELEAPSCDDGDDCTIDLCNGGVCEYTAVECNDNDGCTFDECSGGTCVYTTITCEDEDACTIDFCLNGECQNLTVPCDDGVACTEDACVDGSCEYTPIPGCARVPCQDNTPCIDGDLCTNDICSEGFCENTTVVCDDSDDCTTDECIQGCIYTPVVCDDGDFCTTNECFGGQCVYTPLDCNDNDACTIDACEVGQCANIPVVCDDNDACTNDPCIEGECFYFPVICDDADECTSNACEAGECVYTPVVCDDNDACTIDACVEGACGHIEVVCDDADECTADACADGECHFDQVPDCGEPGNPCSPDFCDDGDPCTVDVSDQLGGCTHTPVTTTPSYLKLSNHTTNSLNLKVLYGNTSSWVNKNVIAGGNTMLCITMRDATPVPDSIAKVHIRLKGSLHSEATRITNNYPAGCVPREWTTVCIPLSQFPTTNFTQVPYIEIFNSAAKAYQFEILKIEFTGGTTPFLWFGEGHTNNFIAGNTAAFNGSLVTGLPCNAAPKMSQSELSTVGSAAEFGNLNAYPNPFENQLMVEFTTEFDGTAELRMVDVLGQVVKSERVAVMAGENKQTMNLEASLAEGIYFLEVRMNNQVRYVKLMK